MVTRLARRGERSESCAYRWWLPCSGWNRECGSALEQSDKEHSLSSLRHAVVFRVENEQGVLVTELLRASEQSPTDLLPARADGQCLDVLHHKRAGLQHLDYVEEVIYVAAPRVVGVHAADPRESLARWPSDHDVRTSIQGWVCLENVPAYGVRLKVCVVGCDRELVAVDRPGHLKACPHEAEI